MKNSIYILVLGVLIVLGACDSGVVTSGGAESLDNLPDYAERVEFDHMPGLVKATVKFGEKIEQQGEYFDGYRNGSWITYHPNELVKSISTYVSGTMHGTHLEMDDKGNLTLKAYYVNGIEEGEFIYYNNGVITEKRNYVAGEFQGKRSQYYDNGKIMEESNWYDGKMHGTAKWYDQDGNVTLEYEYSNGVLLKD
ncbi:toxin-antitoxin system YwqK family antitoxin [Reichenbachiella sp.]|uniref:toxin-antitoxin system YwqK family antitoxin n=1 Tax=Reichenbachiella sp. TaxID=2184521 RepID=UPI003BB098BA